MLRANTVLADVVPRDKIIPIGLEGVRQFINWKLVPSKTGGKPEKVPCNPRGRPIDPHDPANWIMAEQAMQSIHGIGFVLTENDPFFCIDLDGALNGTGWSPLVYEIMAMFPGAAFEISQSGAGVHLFGRGAGSIPADHRCKGEGVELYTRWRFIALTGVSKQGSAAVDFSNVLPGFVSRFGLQRLPAPPAGPRALSLVPLPDDAEIIRKACDGRGSIRATFGVHFRDLWRSNDARLAAEWPASGRADKCLFDRSRADASLLTHLAFWTNGDEGAMDRLFRQSDLMRPKWDDPKYRDKTLAFAKKGWNGVGYTGAAPAPALPATAASRIESTVAAANASIGSIGYLSTEGQKKLFAGCVYIIDLNMILMPDGRLLAPPSFQGAFGGYEFQMQTDSARPTRNAFEAFTANRMMQFPKVANICFRPSEEPGAIVGDMVNIWRPAVVDEAPGDVAPFLDHLARLLPDARDRKILLTYMQSLVRNPGVKFQWAPVIQGVEGNGKTLLMKAMGHAVSERYAHRPKASQLTEKFNGWMIGKLFIGVEEIKIPDHRREMVEDLKEWITNDWVEIRHVGGKKAMSENFANWMLNTNHKDAVPVNRNQRRFCMLFTAQQSAAELFRDGMTAEYFTRLYSWFDRGGGKQAISWFLRNSPIDPEFDPAGSCQRAPITSSTVEAFAVSLGRIEQEILEAVAEGRAGFRGGWISSIAVDRLLRDKSISGIGPNKKSEIIAALGYRRECRSSCMIAEEDGKQPWLYRKDDHPPEPYSATSTLNFKACQGYR